MFQLNQYLGVLSPLYVTTSVWRPCKHHCVA